MTSKENAEALLKMAQKKEHGKVDMGLPPHPLRTGQGTKTR